MKVNFANNLKNLRKIYSLSQKQLAEKLNVDQRTISAWENEICQPSLEMLLKICQMFNETLDSLILD